MPNQKSSEVVVRHSAGAQWPLFHISVATSPSSVLSCFISGECEHGCFDSCLVLLLSINCQLARFKALEISSECRTSWLKCQSHKVQRPKALRRFMLAGKMPISPTQDQEQCPLYAPNQPLMYLKYEVSSRKLAIYSIIFIHGLWGHP